MKKIVLAKKVFTLPTVALALLVALAGISLPALAQQAESSKIAVVDIRVAVLQTEKAQAAIEELKKQTDFKSNLDDIEKLEAELKTMVETYQKDRAVMSAEKRGDEEKRIIDKQKDLQYIAGKLQQAQQDLIERAMDEQAEAVKRVLQNLVEEQSIGMLLRADAGGIVMHADRSYDISAQVTERLNQIK